VSLSLYLLHFEYFFIPIHTFPDPDEGLLDPQLWRKEKLEEENLEEGEGGRLYPLLDSTYHRQVR
jgi:hypothetical protein